jgi:ATP-binding cassette subfamily B protein
MPTESVFGSRPSIAGPTRIGPWLRGYLTPYRTALLIYLVGTFAWQALTAAIPWLSGAGFDAILRAAPDVHYFTRLIVVLLFVVLVRGAIGIATTYTLEYIGNGVERDVRAALYRGLLGKGQPFFDRWRVGELLARATGDAGQINQLFQPGLEFLLIAAYGTLLPLVVIGSLDPQLLLAPVLFLAAFALAVRRHDRRLGPVSDRLQQRAGALSARLAESLAGIDLIAAAGQRAREGRAFAREARDYRDAFIRRGQAQARYLPPLLVNVALVGGLLHGLLLVSSGRLTIGELVAYLGLIGLLQQPVEALGVSVPLIRLGLSSARRIIEVLDEDRARQEHSGGHRAAVRGEVAFEDVRFAYDGAPALDGVSFTAGRGETIALVGATGAGKSTIVKLLNRTYDGSVGLCGDSCGKQRVRIGVTRKVRRYAGVSDPGACPSGRPTPAPPAATARDSRPRSRAPGRRSRRADSEGRRAPGRAPAPRRAS